MVLIGIIKKLTIFRIVVQYKKCVYFVYNALVLNETEKVSK